MKWSEYRGQSNAVSYMRNCISNNKFPSAILITGPPGVGKSLLTELTIRSVICTSNTDKPCGECSYCSTNIRELDNVKWQQISNLDGMTDLLYDINLWSKEAPIYLDGLGCTRKFVVLDEIQLLTSTHIQSLLGYIDTTPATTTWVLISMDLSKLSSTILDALSSRCKEIELNSHTRKDCIDYVLNNHSYSYDDASLLSILSEGNMRKINNLIDYCKGVSIDRPITDILIGGAKDRSIMWKYLHNKEYKNAINVCDKWLKNSNASVLLKLFIEDIIKEIEVNPSIDLLHDLDLLIKYSSNNIKTSLAYYVTLLRGFNKQVEETIAYKSLNMFKSFKELEDYYLEYCIH